MNGGGAHPLSSCLLASLFLRPQDVFSEESPTQRKTVSLYRKQDFRPAVCLCSATQENTLLPVTLALNDFLQVIKIEEEVCAICIENSQLLAYFGL